MAGKSGFKLGGADIQLLAIVSPQRFFIDLQNTADFTLGNPLGSKQLDNAAVGCTGDVRRSSGGAVPVFHDRREKLRGRYFAGEKKSPRVRRAGPVLCGFCSLLRPPPAVCF